MPGVDIKRKTGRYVARPWILGDGTPGNAEVEVHAIHAMIAYGIGMHPSTVSKQGLLLVRSNTGPLGTEWNRSLAF